MVCGEHVRYHLTTRDVSTKRKRDDTPLNLHHLNAGEQSGAKEHQNNFTPTPKQQQQQQPPNDDDAPLFLRLSRFRVVVVVLLFRIV
jgi:hypothetical protein